MTEKIKNKTDGRPDNASNKGDKKQKRIDRENQIKRKRDTERKTETKTGEK